jgi:trehalose utilization protein
MKPIVVTVWNENIHEKTDEKVRAIYPTGIHGCLADVLSADKRLAVSAATLDDEDQGLSDDCLSQTDVLFWWAHLGHDRVSDDRVEAVYNRVMDGMGLVVLHSGHYSKIFRRLMGTGCRSRWREDQDKERLFVIEPGHPIAAGLPEYFELDHEETYGERFNIPAPDTLVLISWFSGGEVCRSGCCYNRGEGKVFYFRPGHETFPTYHNPNVQQILRNAAVWASPSGGPKPKYGNSPALETHD